MYYLTIGAMMKNEAHGIQEWLDHYFAEGVDHVYLIDDGSTDDTLTKVAPYVEKGQVTVIHGEASLFLGRQRYMYNTYLLPRLPETTWMWILDTDEYLWSPAYPTLAELMRNVHGCGQVQVNHTLFGSNGHQEQPSSIIAGFTRRSACQPSEPKQNLKYAVHSSYSFSSLNVHHAEFSDSSHYEYPHFMSLGPDFLIMNHYSCQSRDTWSSVKMTRGDADHYMTRGWSDFDEIDLNEVEDTRLLERISKRNLGTST